MNSLESFQSTLHLQYPVIPPLLSNIVDLFCQTHVCYHTYIQANSLFKHEKENHFDHIFMAAGIQLIGKQFNIIDKTLSTLVISKCALDIMNAFNQLNNNWLEFKNTINGVYPIKIVSYSPHFKKKKELSVPFFEIVKTAMISLIFRMQNFIKVLFSLIGQLFLTSMCLREIYLIYYNQNEQKRFEVLVNLISEHENYKTLFCQQIAELNDELNDLAILTSSIGDCFGLKIDKSEVKKVLFGLKNQINQQLEIILEEGKNSLNSILDPNVLKVPSIELRNPDAMSISLPDQSIPLNPEFSGDYWNTKNLLSKEITCKKNENKIKKTKENNMSLSAKICNFFNLNKNKLFS